MTFCKGCCASCKEEHDKTVGEAQQWPKFATINWTIAIILWLFCGPGVVVWYPCFWGDKGCCQFIKLFLLMWVMTVFTGGIGGFLWSLSWVLSLKAAAGK